MKLRVKLYRLGGGTALPRKPLDCPSSDKEPTSSSVLLWQYSIT